jgi:putative ABC transport system substrate-binding protein
VVTVLIAWGLALAGSMTISIGRRELMTALGSAAVAWPFAARAQQSALPVIGWLNSGSAHNPLFAGFLTAFRAGLKDAGYVEDQNVEIDFRWGEGQYARLPALAAELVGKRVAVITAGGPPAARAAKAATETIPIVFTVGDDPVKLGLVASLNRPGGNATGVNLIDNELEAKRLGLLREVVPAANTIAVLLNPTSPAFDTQSKVLQAGARAQRTGDRDLNGRQPAGHRSGIYDARPNASRCAFGGERSIPG